MGAMRGPSASLRPWRCLRDFLGSPLPWCRRFWSPPRVIPQLRAAPTFPPVHLSPLLRPKLRARHPPRWPPHRLLPGKLHQQRRTHTPQRRRRARRRSALTARGASARAAVALAPIMAACIGGRATWGQKGRGRTRVLRRDVERAIASVVEAECPLCIVELRVHDGRACCPCCGDTYSARQGGLEISPCPEHQANCRHW